MGSAQPTLCGTAVRPRPMRFANARHGGPMIRTAVGAWPAALSAAAVALAAFTAGCGGGDGAGAAMHDWYGDIAAGRGAQACARLTPSARKPLEWDLVMLGASTCETAIAEIAD